MSPTTAAEREQMLRTIGVSSVEDLFRDVPQQMYLDGYLDLPPGRSELETLEAVSALEERNRVFKTCLRGAGSYPALYPRGGQGRRDPRGICDGPIRPIRPRSARAFYREFSSTRPCSVS